MCDNLKVEPENACSSLINIVQVDAEDMLSLGNIDGYLRSDEDLAHVSEAYLLNGGCLPLGQLGDEFDGLLLQHSKRNCDNHTLGRCFESILASYFSFFTSLLDLNDFMVE